MTENKINVAEILANKPQRIKLYSPICGEVVFDKIERDLGHYTIFVTTPAQTHYTFMEDGKYERNSECLLFPSKEMHSWEKFVWKKGDVLVGSAKTIVFDKFTDDTYTLFKGKYCIQEDPYSDATTYIGEDNGLTKYFHIPEKIIAQCYINTIEEKLGRKLNIETLEIEEAKPKWTPKPFDKVVARDDYDHKWQCDFFSHFDKDSDEADCIICIGGMYYNDVLPYNEETAKLIGTTNNWK